MVYNNTMMMHQGKLAKSFKRGHLRKRKKSINTEK